jgi:glycosyltransferase involved in cell wall biosynthesis
MRVAVVSMRTSHHEPSPQARRLDAITQRLANRGHDVHVFCSQWWDANRDVYETDGVTYHGVTVSPALASFVTRLPVMLARFGPDVIHAGMHPAKQVLAARTGGSMARAPVVVELVGDDELPATKSTRLAIRTPSRVVTPSRLIETRAREFGAADGSTAVIPEAIDWSLVSSTAAADSADVVFARHMDETANVEDLLLALAELRDRDWRAHIIGEGPRKDEYETQAQDLRIDDRVTFLGNCSREERIAHYKGAHVFVQTAYREYFATELLWALACGCIGIVEYQAASSAHELIEHHDRSFRVTSPEELADSIAESGRLERRSKDEDFKAYDQDEVLEQYLDCYRDAMDSYGLF